jgi:hypothetical protein
MSAAKEGTSPPATIAGRRFTTAEALELAAAVVAAMTSGLYFGFPLLLKSWVWWGSLFWIALVFGQGRKGSSLLLFAFASIMLVLYHLKG